MEKRDVGRPKIQDNDETIRVGFTINSSLWSKLEEKIEKYGVKKSEYFRIMVESDLEDDE